MLISERIFGKLKELGMTQKEFSKRTGIRETTISEWKKKHTNPSADKIMVICNVLNVSPEWLLSGAEVKKGRQSRVDWYVISKDSEMGAILEEIGEMDEAQRARLKVYARRLKRQ